MSQFENEMSRLEKELDKIIKWDFNESMLNNLTCLTPENVMPKHITKDCGINSLDFLKQIKDKTLAKYLAYFANTSEMRTKNRDMISLLYDSYAQDEMVKENTFSNAVYFHNAPNFFDLFITKLGKNKCTFIKICNEKLFCHAVVIAVRNNGELIVIDQQQELVMPATIYFQKEVNPPHIGIIEAHSALNLELTG